MKGVTVKLTNVNVAMRDACIAAAKQGLAFDYAWADELTGRTFAIPTGPTIRDKPRAASDAAPAGRGGAWSNRFAKRAKPAAPAAQSVPSVTKDIDMSPSVSDQLMQFLQTVLSDADMRKASAILASGNDPELHEPDPALASDAALRRRVQEGVARKRGETAARLEQRFPHMNRLAG